MAAVDPAFEYLQRIQSMMESIDESLSQLCKDNISESAQNLRKNLMESYNDLYKALQSRYETLKIKEKNLEEPVTKVTGSNPVFNSVLSSVGVRSEIEILYDKSDDRGLRNYIIDHMKDVKTLRNELMALLKAPDAAKLVTSALDPPFFPNKKASVLLFECLYLTFGKNDSCVLPSDVTDLARKIAKAWKKEMNMESTTRASRVNIMAFLKLLASFRIAADYERDELWRLIFTISRNNETLEVCRSLGLSPNISEFIDMLSKGGKQLEVLTYADAFGVLHKVDHVELLTSYLRDVENAGKEVVMNGQGMAASQAPDYMARLQTIADIKLGSALRAVINLATKYGLNSHVFEDKLRKLEQGKEPEEQPEPGTSGKNNESKTSNVTGLTPPILKLEQWEINLLKNGKNARRNIKKAAKKKAEQEEDERKADEKKAQEKEDGNKAAKKKAENIEEKEDGKKASEKMAQEIEEREDGKKASEKIAQEIEEREDGKKAAEKRAHEKEEKEGGKKDAEKKAQQKDDGNKVAGKKAWEKKDGKKVAGKRAQEKAGKKDAEKKAQEKEDGEKDAEKKAQHKRRQSFELGYKLSESENYASKRAKHASSNETTRVVKQKAEQEEDGKKASEKKALKEDGKNAVEKNAQENEDGKKAAENKAQVNEQKEDRKKAAEKKAQVNEEREVGKKAAENKAQHKRRHSFEPGYGLSERENYASKRAKDASLNETTRVVGMDNSKPSPYNIDGVQYNYGLIGHHHHPSASSAANTGLAAGAFASVPSIGAQINNERRRHEGNPLAFGTSNLTPIGSSLYSASVHADPFAVPLSNVAAVNYDGRDQRSNVMNFVEVDKNHVRTLVYGTTDLLNSFAMQNNYNFEGRGKESYKLNLGEIHNNPVRASSYVTGVSANSSATECHYERKVPELYTSAFGSGDMAGIGSSVYGSNPCTIPSSVNQGSHEKSLGQSSGFAGRNAVPPSSVSTTVPLSSVSQGHFERRGSVINKYTFNSG